MAQRSRFFDSSGGDRIYTSDAWAQVVGAIIGDGVVATGNELAVAEASPPAMSVRVNTGKAFIGGYYFEVHTARRRWRSPPRTRPCRGSTASSCAATSPAGPRSWPSSRARPRTRRRRQPSPRWRPASGRSASRQVAVAAAAASIVDANITDERGPRAKGTDIENLAGRRSWTRRAAIATRARLARAARSATPTSRGSRPTTTTPSPTPTAATGRARSPTRRRRARRRPTTTPRRSAGPDANVTVDAAGAAGHGRARSPARRHGHQVATSGATPADVAAAGAAGATGALARAGARPRPRLGLPARRPPRAGPRPELAHGHRRRHQRLGPGVRGRRRGGREGLGRHDRSRRVGRRGRHLGEEVGREA